ncbi:MAG: hypothetical protein LJF04_01085 [Gemmatimonadetes bacterium]|nr:hypothetical protein [Gemmatimonadota bacterium]
MTRALNITLRTLHIAAMAVLVGGVAFDVAPQRLSVDIWLTVATGVALAAMEAGPRLTWFHEGRGVMTLVKVALLCAMPMVGTHRLPLLLVVIGIGSVASHMPRRFRHYSLLSRRVIHDYPSPGGGSA